MRSAAAGPLQPGAARIWAFIATVVSERFIRARGTVVEPGSHAEHHAGLNWLLARADGSNGVNVRQPAGSTQLAGRPAASSEAAAPAPPRSESAVLEHRLSRFLVDLSIALHRFAMYPPGHPSLADALETLGRGAEALLLEHPKIAVGVARDRLVIEGVVTDARHALLSALADRLHRHLLSALTIRRGVTMRELGDVVRAIASDPSGDAGPLGRGAANLASAWPHVSLYPLSAGGLEMIEETESEAAPADRSAELWVGLARAALGREVPDSSGGVEPAAVARAIDEHQPVEAYDQVIVGYLQQIAEEVRTAQAPDTVELRRRVSALVSAMHPDTLRRLLAMGGDALRRRTFVRAASAGMSAGAVVDLVKAAAEASAETLSNGLVRLLSKLAAHADAGAPTVQPLADSALRLQVEQLTAGWDLADPNPADYADVLQRIAESSSPVPRRPAASRDAADPLRILQICLELEEEAPALWRALDALVDGGDAVLAIDLLQPAGAGGGLGRRAWDRMVSADTVRRLLARVPPAFTPVDALLPHLHGDALAPLFDLLLDSDDRHVRRAAFDRLRRTGADGAAQALARSADERWYVQRNLLALLAEIEQLPASCDPRPWLTHDDARVRREALRVALRLPAIRDAAVGVALHDGDERVLRVAVNAASERPCRGAAAQLLVLAAQEALADDLRALAIQALVRASRSEETLQLLLQLATRTTRRLRWPARDSASRTSLAALGALAACWPQNAKAAAIVRRAAAAAERDARLESRKAAP